MSKDYDPYSRSYGNSIFLICSALLFMGAIAIFIWLLIDASEQHFVKNILYAAAFLVITLGVLVYSLCAYKAPHTASTVMWVTMGRISRHYSWSIGLQSCAYKAPHTASTVMWVTMGIGIAVFIVGLCLKDPVQSVEISNQPLPVTQTTEIPSNISFSPQKHITLSIIFQ